MSMIVWSPTPQFTEDNLSVSEIDRIVLETTQHKEFQENLKKRQKFYFPFHNYYKEFRVESIKPNEFLSH